MLGALALSEAPLSAPSTGVRIDLFASASVLVALQLGSVSLVSRASLTINPDTRIFAATDDYISRPTDRISDRLFAGTMRQALRFNRSVRSGMAFDGLSLGLGEAILTNSDGAYDNLIGTHALDGRRVVIRLGDANSAHDTFGTVFDGQSTGYHVNDEEFVVELRDNTYLLDVPASASTFKGTGGIEGGEDLKERRKPRPFGFVENVTPVVLTQDTSLVHCVGSGPVKAISAVYVRGVKLNLGTDYPTFETLAASTVTKGAYNTCLAQALFRPAFTVSEDIGQYTADVEGELIDGRLAETTADIVALLARGGAGVQLDAASFARVNTSDAAPVCYYLPAGDETTIARLMTVLMQGIGGWVGFRRNGLLEVAVLEKPKADATALRLTDVEIVSIDREALPDGIDPPPYRLRTAWGLNWTVQDDNLAGTVSEARRAWLKEQFRIATLPDSEAAIGAAIKLNHPLAQDPAVLSSFFRYEADAVRKVRQRLLLFRDCRSLYRVTARVAPFSTDIGRIVHITYPRWDLSTGRFFRVVEIDEDTENNLVEILAYG